jgi:hypothetical protein
LTVQDTRNNFDGTVEEALQAGGLQVHSTERPLQYLEERLGSPPEEAVLQGFRHLQTGSCEKIRGIPMQEAMAGPTKCDQIIFRVVSEYELTRSCQSAETGVDRHTEIEWWNAWLSTSKMN